MSCHPHRTLPLIPRRRRSCTQLRRLRGRGEEGGKPPKRETGIREVRCMEFRVDGVYSKPIVRYQQAPRERVSGTASNQRNWQRIAGGQGDKGDAPS